MSVMKLEPRGVHLSPSGVTRYAIWSWTDADGELLVPCNILDILDRVPALPAGSTCATPRQRVAFGNRLAHRRIMERDGLVDDNGRLTEKGAVIRFIFQHRDLVRSGYETPHGLRLRAVERVPF